MLTQEKDEIHIMHEGLQQNGVCTKKVTKEVKGLGIM